jgi:hypothetical protein
MKEIKQKKLEESFESGAITNEEYEKQKKEIESMPEEKREEPEEEVKEAKLKSDKILIIGVLGLVLILAAIFGLSYFNQELPETIDELHELNLKGKLKSDQGYIYDVYSFVKFDDLWYTQFKSPQGSRLYNVQFRYGPREVEDIRIIGDLDTELFNNATDYYVTFNPAEGNFSAMALAIGDFNEHMSKIFFKQPIAACDRNATACVNRPIITCENTDKIVLYVKESENSRVVYDDNCIIVEGKGLELVRGVDKALLDFYEIIE